MPFAGGELAVVGVRRKHDADDSVTFVNGMLAAIAVNGGLNDFCDYTAQGEPGSSTWRSPARLLHCTTATG